MGNRAVITAEGAKKGDLGLYLHWNGGPESVLAFLEAAKRMKVRPLTSDPEYGYARLCQVIGNFFRGTLSLGVGTLGTLDCDNGDNGTYRVDDKWQIAKREYSKNTATRVEDLAPDELKRYEGILAEVMGQSGLLEESIG
jgi:hypothetical protein